MTFVNIKFLFKVARYDYSHIGFFGRSTLTYGFKVVVKASYSGNMGFIPAGC